MDYEYFMQEALKESIIAKKEGNRAFSAILVKDDEIVARSHNKVLSSYDPTSHAELIIIKDFCTKNSISDLREYTLYSTCEPCPMCASAIVWAKIGTIVYGCDNDEWPTNYKRQNNLSCEEVIKRSWQDIKIIKHILREECKKSFV